MDEAVLGHQVHNAVALADLHRDGEIVGRLIGEEYIHGLLRKSRIFCSMVNFDDVKFGTSRRAHGEREEFVRHVGVLCLELSKRSGMSINRLRNSALLAVELHRSFNTEGIRIHRVARDTNKDHPLAIGGCTIVDDLCVCQAGMTIKYLLRRSIVFNAPVIDTRRCYDTKDRS